MKNFIKRLQTQNLQRILRKVKSQRNQYIHAIMFGEKPINKNTAEKLEDLLLDEAISLGTLQEKAVIEKIKNSKYANMDESIDRRFLRIELRLIRKEIDKFNDGYYDQLPISFTSEYYHRLENRKYDVLDKLAHIGRIQNRRGKNNIFQMPKYSDYYPQTQDIRKAA